MEQDLTNNQIGPERVVDKAHGNSIECVAVHPNHEEFATGSHDHSIKVWDVSLKEKMSLCDHKEGAWSLEYSPDGTLLLSASPDRTILLWDSRKGSAGARFQGHRGKVYCARFSPDAKELVSCGEESEVLFWDVAQPKAPVKALKLP